MNDHLVEITASVINQQVENVSSRLAGELKDFWTKHVSSFKRYIELSKSRYESTKTLLYKDRPVHISDIYVGTRLKHGSHEITEKAFMDQFIQGNRCLVRATAGSGKSFFSKWVFLSILSAGRTIPLFIELRNLNGTDMGIVDYLVHDLWSNFKVNLTRDLMIDLIDTGRFALILDGYDELTSDKTKAVNAELRMLEVPFTNSAILITSRPGGEELSYLPGFTTYRILPLEMAQAVSLVRKLEYDEVIKNSFLRNLETELFEQHKDFLSNPLLLTIMLMTYGDLAEIPSKMHIFYEQAFDTLFYRHDSSKGMYRRELKSQLAIDDFRDVLSCISASSYIRGQVSLTNTDLVSFIRKAKKTANIHKLNPQSYIDDLVQSVCLFLQDGTKYTYNHRSFQEYFAALFLTHIPSDRKYEVYLKYLEREETDSALSLAFEINQIMVEREFIQPMLGELLDLCSTPEDLMNSHMKGFNLIRTEIAIKDADGSLTKVLDHPGYFLEGATRFWKFQLFLERMYKNKSKRFLRFGVMTKKAFEEEFGKEKVEKNIPIEGGISSDDYSILERLGIIKIAQRRLDFLEWLRAEVDRRDQRTGDSHLENWL